MSDLGSLKEAARIFVPGRFCLILLYSVDMVSQIYTFSVLTLLFLATEARN